MSIYTKTCKNCNRQFKSSGSKTIFCPECSEVKVKCFICGKDFITSRLIYEKTLQDKRKFLCSRKCSSTYAGYFSCKNLYKAYCDVCKEETLHNLNGTCKKCISLQNMQSESMQKWIHSEEADKIRRINAQKWNNSNEGREFHSRLLSNFNKTEAGRKNTQNNLKIIHNLMSQGYGANSQENIRKRILNTNFGGRLNFKDDNHNLYYDYSIEDYIPWEDYKRKFITKTNIRCIKDILSEYPNAFIQSTFRNQNSIDWSGAKQAFEYNLIEKNVNWFCYIKLYIDKSGEIKPLVVGKSGSYNVNTSGSDVSFSLNIEHGPSRRFLNEEKVEWDKTQIIIIPSINEKEAYKIEKDITIKFNLFQS